SVVAEGIRQQAFPGCVLFASKGDSILIKKKYGFHTYDSTKLVEDWHIYDLASITKVTAATLAIMKLYEEDLIKLDDHIGMHIPGLGRRVGSISFRAYLAHQSGIRSWIPYYNEIKTRKGFKRKHISTVESLKYDYQLADSLYLRGDFYKIIKKFIKKAPVDQVKEYRYSGLFFYLVPELVQRLTGQSFAEYLREHFYTPLGAETLGFNPLSHFSDSVIVPTELDTFFRMKPIHGQVHDEGAIMMQGISGNAGLFSNAEDLAKVWRMLLNEGMVDSIRYLSPQTITLFTTAHFPANENRRGLGFDKPAIGEEPLLSPVSESASLRSYGHSGYTGTFIWADPEYDLLFIFLSNRVYPTRKNTKLYELNLRSQLHQLVYDLANLK
ncbi:MAG: serine hydrolase, partial [Cyclobacteriaceae bacterium]|nr:serine hydrolase [Cyclobacteriaceae bacterium HetDA_MAG_MS6]